MKSWLAFHDCAIGTATQTSFGTFIANCPAHAPGGCVVPSGRMALGLWHPRAYITSRDVWFLRNKLHSFLCADSTQMPADSPFTISSTTSSTSSDFSRMPLPAVSLNTVLTTPIMNYSYALMGGVPNARSAAPILPEPQSSFPIGIRTLEQHEKDALFEEPPSSIIPAQPLSTLTEDEKIALFEPEVS